METIVATDDVVVLKIDRRVLSIIHAALQDGIAATNNFMQRDMQHAYEMIKKNLPAGKETTAAKAIQLMDDYCDGCGSNTVIIVGR